MLGTAYKMSDASELWVGGEVKRGQTTPVPSTVVSAKATDTLGSDTPGKDLSDLLSLWSYKQVTKAK